MTGAPTVEENELHAYADGQLPAARLPAVKELLAADPAARSRVAAWRTQNELIGCLYDPPEGDRWPGRLAPHRLDARSRRRSVRAAIAAALALTVGLAGGWWAHGMRSTTPPAVATLARLGADLHRTELQRRFDTPLEFDPRRLAAGLARALAHPVAIPDLAGAGLRLVGGRALPVATASTAAQLIYVDTTGLRFTLYLVRPENIRDPSTEPLRADDLAGLAWSYEEFHCLLIADAAPERLREISRAIQAQLDAADDTG
ncbi:MAG: anti-sigma factor [Geminicoccaceae bacterium]